jgi:hypothetical protein
MSTPNVDRSFWFLAAMILLTGLTLYTRGAAPWQEFLTNDEMLHLESWRNRYRTDDICPSFVEKAKITGLLEGRTLELFERAYGSGALCQRGLLVLNDLHPPTFPLLAEVLEALTHSSLTTVRMVSAIASALAVLFAYRLGAALRGPALGIWLGTLFAIGYLGQIHAGIARPYALTQFAVVLALFAFVCDQLAPDRPPWRFLLASLFVQSTDWPAWVIMFPLVAVVLVRRYRRGGIGPLLGQTWWYAAASALMLPFLAIQLSKGVAGMFVALRPMTSVWYCHALASPFASMDWLLSIEPGSILSPAAILLLMLVFAGVGGMVGDPGYCPEVSGSGLAVPSVRVGLLLTLMASVALSVFGVPGHLEAILVFVVVPTVFAGVGLHWVLRAERASLIAAAATLAIFTVGRIGWPEDPYARSIGDTDYAAVAQRITTELGPGDVWTAFGRHRADCLYRYGPLPDPVLHLTRAQFREFLDTLPRPDAAVLVFARMDVILTHHVLRTAPQRWEFVNGFQVVRIPPQASGPVPSGEHRQRIPGPDAAGAEDSLPIDRD